MTREEINILQDIVDIYEKEDMYPLLKDKQINTIKMVIQALEQEPCEDAISRQAVLDYIDKMPSELTADGRRMIRRRTLEEYISDTLPSVTQEPKTGHWIGDNQAFYIYAKCSECGSVHDTATNYCPDCGCLMDRTEFDEYVKTEGA